MFEVSLSLLLGSVVLVPVLYLFFTFARFYLDVRRRAKYYDLLPGAELNPSWLLGVLKEFPGPDEKGLIWMKEVSKLFKEGFGITWFGPFFPHVAISHPTPAKIILKSSDPKPSSISGGYTFILPWLGDGLLLAKGSKWTRNRRLLTPAFHFEILRPYMEINNKCTDVFMDKISSFAARDEYFEAFTHVSQLTLDIILRCAFSYDNDCQLKGHSHPYVKAVNSLAEAATRRLLSPWLYLDFIYYNLTPTGRQFKADCEFVHRISEEIISKRRQVLQGKALENIGKSRYVDFLDILLTAKDDEGKGLTDLEIRDECDTFLFEGHDTTASGISWTLYSIASHPEIQRKCQEEIDQILQDKQNKDIEWDDLPKLKYLTMCIKEALRMHTPVPFIQRQTTKDLDLEGYHIPAGTIVDLNLYVLHHHSDIWNEPETFMPERFSPDNLQKMDNFAFVPFSAGPRNCIGQNFAMHEMKTAVAKILRRFTLSLDPARPVRHRIVVIMKTEQGMFMKATPRTVD